MHADYLDFRNQTTRCSHRSTIKVEEDALGGNSCHWNQENSLVILDLSVNTRKLAGNSGKQIK